MEQIKREDGVEQRHKLAGLLVSFERFANTAEEYDTHGQLHVARGEARVWRQAADMLRESVGDDVVELARKVGA